MGATRRLTPVLVVLLAMGCTEPEPKTPLDEDGLKAQIETDNQDPWPHYGLARLYEQRGAYEEAITHYGLAINLLPPRSATRPVLDLGILHHRMGSTKAAYRCYQEVLDTFPADTSRFKENGDYRQAALGTKAILEKELEGKEDSLEALHSRYLEELGGSEENWERGPVWITPLPSPGKD